MEGDITDYYSDLYEGKMKNIIRNTTEPERQKKSNVGCMSVIDKSGREMSKVLRDSQQLIAWTVHHYSEDMEMKRFRCMLLDMYISL
jgi:hypothetical protein